MAKSVDDRIEEIKEIWIDNDIGASDWLQEIRRQLVEHGKEVRREERKQIQSTVQDAVDMLWPLTDSGEEAAHGDGG